MSSNGSLPVFKITQDSRSGEYTSNRMNNTTFFVAHHGMDSKGIEEFVCFGIFDGHDGPEAAQYAKDHLLDAITSRKKFWSDKDSSVMNTIRKGFVQIQYDMWKIHETWPRRADQFFSTSGTTASIVFIKKGKIYTAHVGDSGIVLGYQKEGKKKWKSRALTSVHTADMPSEKSRIVKCGGKVDQSSGTARVVWSRPSLKHKGPGMISNLVDEIPFSALSRSLGDLWSYNCKTKEYIISAQPDVSVHRFKETFRCLIIGTNGLWDTMDPNDAVCLIKCVQKNNAKNIHRCGSPDFSKICLEHNENEINPSTWLVTKAQNMWRLSARKGHSASVVTVLLDSAYACSNRTQEPIGHISGLRFSRNK